MDSQLRAKLLDFKQYQPRITGRLFKKSYQFITEIATDYLREKGYKDFRVGHLVLLLHIEIEGTTVNSLAHKAGVTKQAMSKLVQELVELGHVRTEKKPNDARAILVQITEQGANFILEWQHCTKIIDEKIMEIVGKEKLEQVKDILQELVEYFETNHEKGSSFAETMKMKIKL